MPPRISLQTFQPGYANITGLTFVENSHCVTGTFSDSYYFDATIRVFATECDNPFILCSLRLAQVLPPDIPHGFYEIEATVREFFAP